MSSASITFDTLVSTWGSGGAPGESALRDLLFSSGVNDLAHQLLIIDSIRQSQQKDIGKGDGNVLLVLQGAASYLAIGACTCTCGCFGGDGGVSGGVDG